MSIFSSNDHESPDDEIEVAREQAFLEAAAIAHQSQVDCFCSMKPDEPPCIACMEAARIEGALRARADREWRR